MNRNELEKKLLDHNVPSISFNVNGIKEGECMCLVSSDSKWKVVYNSRGHIIDIAEFDNENDACDFMYSELKKEYKW